jgi:hypothetical protein
VMLENETAERAADVGPDDAKNCCGYPPHGLTAGHEQTRDRADDEPDVINQMMCKITATPSVGR